MKFKFSGLLIVFLITGCIQGKKVNKKVIESIHEKSDEITRVVIEDNFNQMPTTNPSSDQESTSDNQTSTEDQTNTESTTDDSATSDISDELTKTCGTLYQSKSGYFVLIGDDSKYYIVYSETVNAESVFNTLSFPNDSFKSCVWGDVKNIYIFRSISAQYAQLDQAVAHPERESLSDGYSYELCGEIKYYTDQGNEDAHIQMRSKNMDYIITDLTDSNSIEQALEEKALVKGCLYGTKAPYSDHTKTFKKFFKANEASLGYN